MRSVFTGSDTGPCEKITELAKNNDRAKEIITELYNNGISYFTEWVRDNMLGQVTFVINGIMGIFGTAVNCLVAFIVAIYVLLSKDTFKRQTKKLVSAFLRSAIYRCFQAS